MNTRGQAANNEIGQVIGIAIIAIVGIVLLIASAQNIHPTINTELVNNSVITMGAIDGVSILPGQAVLSSGLNVTNTTGTTLTRDLNYSIANNQVVNGALTATITALVNGTNDTTINFTGTVEPDGYSSSSGARSIAGIIILLFGLGIAIVMLEPTLRSGVFKALGK